MAVTDADPSGEGDMDAADLSPSSARREMPAENALALLKTDHETVKQLFEQVLSDESSMLLGKRPIIDRILAELELHAKIEEVIFYPALKQKTKRDTEDRRQLLEAAEEHGSVKELIRKIKRSTGRDETLRAKVKVLKELVEHHVEEEESAMFPEAERLLGAKKLQQLGVEIATAKQRASGRAKRSTAKKTSAKKTPARGAAKPSAKRSEV